ncbi:dihydropteroate synthase [Candidatus Nitrotoga arctica]|uniref:Dihydropteroate synthase n=1 Tax=Candidatus Nitrotoga arctica TaxID=453162 RepID=A0ABN8ALM4_9PROT|nr:dihydropteroate synthase [Candidatus Nitrotoga arctica]CAG9933726.1 dihydropteroate synthase [Candidatus Nitrotoga arctica]
MLLHCGSFKLDLSRTLVMGIVNITPDSFYDGGRHSQHDAALIHAHQLIQEGADLLDIGGESTRPGALSISVQEELDRIMPVIEGLHGAPVPLSVDTYKAEVMRSALAAGASMINDINALQQPDALAAVAASDVAVCLMHKQGALQAMQPPHYQDVVAEVLQFLRSRIVSAQKAGIARERIMVDPGFGFDKTLAHNLALLRHLDKFSVLGVPLLAGLSRKSMLGTITGQDVEHRVHASVAAALLAVMRGACMVRVHDVRATVDALKILNAVRGIDL